MQTLNCPELNEVKIIQGQKLVCSQYRYLKSSQQYSKNLIYELKWVFLVVLLQTLNFFFVSLCVF